MSLDMLIFWAFILGLWFLKHGITGYLRKYTWDDVEAVVTDIEKVEIQREWGMAYRYYLKCEYVHNGKKYPYELRGNKDSAIGDKIKLQVNHKKPTEVSEGGNNFLLILGCVQIVGVLTFLLIYKTFPQWFY